MIPLDHPPLPCTDHVESFGVLIENRSRSAFDRNIRENAAALCRPLCHSCPIVAQCWSDNAGEDWVKQLRRPPRKPPVQRPACGTRSGARMHYDNRETTCDGCRAAESAHKRAQTVKKRAAA